MPRHTQSETPPPVDWDTLFEIWDNAPNPKPAKAQAQESSDIATQPAA